MRCCRGKGKSETITRKKSFQSIEPPSDDAKTVAFVFFHFPSSLNLCDLHLHLHFRTHLMLVIVVGITTNLWHARVINILFTIWMIFIINIIFNCPYYRPTIPCKSSSAWNRKMTVRTIEWNFPKVSILFGNGSYINICNLGCIIKIKVIGLIKLV